MSSLFHRNKAESQEAADTCCTMSSNDKAIAAIVAKLRANGVIYDDEVKAILRSNNIQF